MRSLNFLNFIKDEIILNIVDNKIGINIDTGAIQSFLVDKLSCALVDSKNARPFASSEIKVKEPKVYEDSLSIATYLRENKPVIVNLKYLDADAGKRLIDFICGTAYAINGHMMKIGENIFLFTPSNVCIVHNEEKSALDQGLETEEKEVFFRKVSGIK